MYVVYLHNLSDAALDLFLPLLVLHAPELSTFTAQILKGLLSSGHRSKSIAVVSLTSFADLQLDPMCRFEMASRVILIWAPERVLCWVLLDMYSGICTQLKRIRARPGFASKLELWRKRRMPSDTLADVYDGSWRDFMAFQGSPFSRCLEISRSN